MLDFTLHFRDVAVPRHYSFFTLSPERRDISRLYILHPSSFSYESKNFIFTRSPTFRPISLAIPDRSSMTRSTSALAP